METEPLRTPPHWKHYPDECCLNCGDDLEVFSEYQGNWYGDGDPVRCAASCGYESALSADENGVWLQDGNIDDLLNTSTGGER